MAKFQVAGQSLDLHRRATLTLPASKHYMVQAVKSGEKVLEVESLLEMAIKRKKSETFHSFPRIWKDERFLDLPRTLQHVLSRYPYPLSQGPVVLPTDCLTTDQKNFEATPIPKSVSEVLTAKTVFGHTSSQDCFKWEPIVIGVAAWGKSSAGYEVKPRSELVVSGPASTRSSMSILYTCKLSGCLVHCPCTICTDSRETCKRSCKLEVCQDCNAQCEEHVIKHPREFSDKTDHFMMVTDMMTKFKHVYSYAGIPLTCVSCTRDVQEHQQLHLVWHTRCRFCKYQMRVFEQLSVTTIENYKAAEKILINGDARTCSFCLVQSQDAFARKKHEEKVHRNLPGKFKCDLCERSFSNENALKYHSDKHKNLKFTCDLCGFQTAIESNLTRHKVIHNSEEHEEHQHKCPDCNIDFTNKRNLMRHNKEIHFNDKLHLDYIEDMNEVKVIKCEQCDESFKRKSNLKRHVDSQHGSGSSSFACQFCDKSFTRKDTMSRHVKRAHKQD